MSENRVYKTPQVAMLHHFTGELVTLKFRVSVRPTKPPKSSQPQFPVGSSGARVAINQRKVWSEDGGKKSTTEAEQREVLPFF